MGDDPRRAHALAGWAIPLLACALAGAARADGFRGNLEVQYQRADQHVLVLGADSLIHELTARREFWSQTYELTHTVRFDSGLNVFSQLRLNDISYVKSGERSRTPYGTLRLAHPWFGLAGSYQPITITTPLRSSTLFPAIADTAPRELATFRTQQAQVSGYFSAPRLPHVDVSWIRRHRDADVQGIAATGLSRNASASWGLGPLLLRGGYNDQGSGGTGFSPVTVTQRAGSAGAGLQLTPRRGMLLGMDYDFAQTRHGVPGSRQDLTRAHGATLNGSYTPTRIMVWSLNYGYHRTQVQNGTRDLVQDHEGALLMTLQGRNGLRWSTGGGVRTSHLETRSELTRYATSIASWDGRIRPHWQGTASFSHVTNWNPGQASFSVDGWRAGSRMRLRKGMDLAVDWLVTDTGDTSSQDLRWTTQGSVSVQVTPLRSFSGTLTNRLYHAGPGLFRSTVDSRGTTLDIRWKPWSAFEADASFARTGLLPANDPHVSTTLLNIHWNPVAKLQVTGSYTRSTQTRFAGQQLTGREVYGGRLLAALGRSTTFNTGVYLADPRSHSETRQFDASFIRSFGR